MTIKNKGMIIQVKKLMDIAYTHKPKHKTTILYNDGEFLPIIHLEVEQ